MPIFSFIAVSSSSAGEEERDIKFGASDCIVERMPSFNGSIEVARAKLCAKCLTIMIAAVFNLDSSTSVAKSLSIIFVVVTTAIPDDFSTTSNKISRTDLAKAI